jgi:hypothetical protein
VFYKVNLHIIAVRISPLLEKRLILCPVNMGSFRKTRLGNCISQSTAFEQFHRIESNSLQSQAHNLEEFDFAVDCLEFDLVFVFSYLPNSLMLLSGVK